MDYKKIYDALVEKAKVRGLDKSKHEGYFEIHHIVPVCLGGSDDKSNLVMFTGREHLVAHLLLWKAYPESVPLQRAAWMMSARGVSKVNSYLYETLAEKKRQEASEFMKGRYFKDLTGQRFGRLVVVNQGEDYYSKQGLRYTRWNCLCDCGETSLVHANSLSWGTTTSCGCYAKEISRQSKGNLENLIPTQFKSGKDHPYFGKKMPKEFGEAISKGRNGVKYSEKALENYRLAGLAKRGENNPRYGKPLSEEVKDKISAANKALNLKPWQVSVNLSGNNRDRWLLADYYYELWQHFDKPGTKKFAKIFNEINNDETKYSAYVTMFNKFLTGWIPSEDEEWVKFSEGG